MEKLLYPLWKPEPLEADAFRDVLLSQLAGPLCDVPGVRGLRVCVADSAVEAASGRRMQSSAAVPDAVISLWVDDAGAADTWEPLIAQQAESMTCYLVAEAEPLLNQEAHPTPAGERMYGMCHVVFMSPPESMDREDWLTVWKGSHTQVAIDTQSTFGYRQNVVVRVLGENTPYHAAIVEENFPPEAMSDDHAFYATGGDDEVLAKNMTAMMESCSRFIDFAKIDVLPMSEYLVKPVSAA